MGPMSGALDFVRERKGERQRATHPTDRETDLPPVFQPGEAVWLDRPVRLASSIGCCGLGLCRRRARQACRVAHMKLSHSRAFMGRACLLQTNDLSHRARTDGAAMASMFDAHWHGFVRGIFEPVADCPSPSRAFRAAASMTVRLGRHRLKARPNEDCGRSHRRGQKARCRCAFPVDDQPLRL